VLPNMRVQSVAGVVYAWRTMDNGRGWRAESLDRHSEY
jgi:hypothetical protein